ncbi:nicotinate (nicotinamide) nucleotide adenylyltransferase [candidate division KSB1 bacterium]
MKIGLYGGTFNPIHNAHLIIAEIICDELDLDRMYFIPTAQPPHRKKDRSIISVKFRLDMVKLAIQDNKRFELSTIEADNDNVSYTVDTVKHFSEKFRLDRSGLFFVLGEDNLKILSKWKDPDRISELSTIVVAGRTSEDIKNIPEKIGSFLVPKTPIIRISASLIRKRLKESRSVKYLVPDSVEKYIIENNLYGD